MKKILILCIALILCLLPNIKIGANMTEIMVENDWIANVHASTDIENFLNKIDINAMDLLEQKEDDNYSSMLDYYGGAWIDDNNVPHVAFTRHLPITYDLVNNEFENIVIELVETTLSDLLELQSSISQLEIDSLAYIALDEPSNCLKVGLLDFENMEDIQALIADVNPQNIKVEFVISNRYERYAASVYGGSVIHGESASATCSVGFKAKKGTKSGFVTAAHCYDKNENVYFASTGQMIGNVLARVYSSTMDAEFIETNSNANVLQKGYGSFEFR